MRRLSSSPRRGAGEHPGFPGFKAEGACVALASREPEGEPPVVSFGEDADRPPVLHADGLVEVLPAGAE